MEMSVDKLRILDEIFQMLMDALYTRHLIRQREKWQARAMAAQKSGYTEMIKIALSKDAALQAEYERFMERRDRRWKEAS